MWRIRDRRTFLELRRSGRRARVGAVTVTHLPSEPGEPPRVAFAVPRKVGPAVARNRLRRCVRARLLDRARDPQRGLAPGAYLVSVGHSGAGLEGPAAADLVDACLDRLAERR